jgi:serine/threonine protein kinase
MPDDEDPSDPPATQLGARPTGDPLALEVARARISNALFATEDRVRIGRYQLLQRAGAGGMGVVWSAWDPELERRVAIKLMHVRSERARAAMLREGQSLARLSHPNIVPIYDVGTVDDQVYLVMEWIAGVTLRAYAAGHSTRELLACFLAAGAGVAAAHQAGIVQRDFKPDNVMIGHDGRVRVLDFGLARPERGDGAVAGTPRYMAPEQARGEAPTPAADQFSFGVALADCFAGRDAPAAVASVVARATQPEPAARFPDMAALLAQLAHDPRRTWRRRAVVAVAALVTAAAFAAGRLRPEVEPCAGEPLAQVVPATRSAALADHLARLGPYGAAHAPELVQQLAAHGATWVAARRTACLASHRREVTPALYERGLACLERARAALDTVSDALTRAPIERLADAVLAARNVPDPRRCLAEATTDPVPPPPRALAGLVTALGADATKARYLALATDPAALPLARATAAAATELAYPPLVARAQLALGAALEADPATHATAADAYAAAGDAALRGSDDVAFVEAFAHRLYVAARLGDAAGLAQALPFVTAIARRTGDAGRFARALLYNNAATERLAAGDRPGAIALLRQARAEPAPAERGVELYAVLGNLAMLVPDRGERDALFAEERAQLERSLGPDHPFTLQVRLRAAMFVEHPGAAAARLRELGATYLRLHPDRRDKIAACHAELAFLAVERGDAAEAARAYAITAAQPSPDDAVTALARAELRRLAGDPTGALALAVPAEAALADVPAWWRRVTAADLSLAIAAARAALARSPVPALRAARAAVTDALAHSQATTVQRRRARIDAQLALATHDRGLAAAAIAWYRAATGYDAAIAALTW